MGELTDLFVIIGLGLVLFILVIAKSRKYSLIAFAIMVGIIFIQNIQGTTLVYSLSKALTALVAFTILNLSPIESKESLFSGVRAGRVFRVSTLVLGFVFVLFISQSVSEFFSLDITYTISALLLVACGLVQIGSSVRTFRIVLGLLVMLQGFEILYGAIESSIFVNGLVSLIDLLIALVGSYLLNQGQEEMPG